MCWHRSGHPPKEPPGATSREARRLKHEDKSPNFGFPRLLLVLTPGPPRPRIPRGPALPPHAEAPAAGQPIGPFQTLTECFFLIARRV